VVLRDQFGSLDPGDPSVDADPRLTKRSPSGASRTVCPKAPQAGAGLKLNSVMLALTLKCPHSFRMFLEWLAGTVF